MKPLPTFELNATRFEKDEITWTVLERRSISSLMVAEFLDLSNNSNLKLSASNGEVSWYNATSSVFSRFAWGCPTRGFRLLASSVSSSDLRSGWSSLTFPDGVAKFVKNLHTF